MIMRFFKKARGYVAYNGPVRSIVYLAKFLLLRCRRILNINRYAVKTINKEYKMKLDLKDKGISQALLLYATREGDQVHIVRERVKRGMRVLDIGANIGYYVLLECGMVGDSGKVYAFEPHPDNFRLLKDNVQLNNFLNRAELHQMGVSNKEGSMEFFVSEKSNLHTLNPDLFRSKSENPSFKDSISIGVSDIAKLLLDKNDVDFIRMDIEGHEVEVLYGLSGVIDKLKTIPLILFETHFTRYDDKHHNIRGALLKLFAKGYVVDSIVSDVEARNPLKETSYKPEKTFKTDGIYRRLYRHVRNEDALRYVCDTGGIRAVFLKNKADT